MSGGPNWSTPVGSRREVRSVEGALDDMRAGWRAHLADRDDLAVLARAATVVRDGLAADTSGSTRPGGRAA